MWTRLGSNAFANLAAGVSAISFQLGATAMAARSFDPGTFSVWALALSMANLTPLFAINLSAVVTRQLVPALTAGAQQTPELVMTSARQIARALAVLAVVAIGLAAVALQSTSPLLADIRPLTFAIIVLILTVGQLWQISLQTSFGWHYANEQNWPVAWALLMIRLCALIAMWLSTRVLAGDAIAAALCLTMGHWLGVGVARLRLFAPRFRIVPAGPDLQHQIRATVQLVRWFAVWSLGMAVIQYGLPQVMSLLRTAHYNAFYLAFTLNMVLSGIVGAIGSAMLAPVSRFAARDDRQAMSFALKVLPALIAVLLVAILTMMHMAMPLLVTHWWHDIASRNDIDEYLMLLGFQSLSRSLAVVFGMVMASQTTAMRLVGPTILELTIALGIAVPLGFVLGDRAFLIALSVAGCVTSVALAVVGCSVTRLETRDRCRVIAWFIVTQSLALVAWWLVSR